MTDSVSGLLPRMQQARLARNAARASLESGIAQVKSDVAVRGVGGRIADKASDTATELMADAIEVADQNRAVVAGTVAALGLWFLRRPIMNMAGRMFVAIRSKTKENSND